MTSFRRSGVWVLFLATGLVALSCNAVLGIEEYGPGAGAGVEGGVDATQTNDSSLGDATPASDGASDAGEESDATQTDDGATNDADTDSCAAVLARLLGAPIVPPAGWAGLDLTNGGVSNDVPGSGGLRLSADLLACAAYVEPTQLGAKVAPLNGGYRAAGFGDSGGVDAAKLPYGLPFPLEIDTNLQSGAIDMVTLSNGYTGVLAFHSRAGGAYGTHTYEVSIGALGSAPADGGSGWIGTGGGSVRRDGLDFPADWSLPTTDAGVQLASPWLNELYDGLMATFDPTEPAVADCFSTPTLIYDYTTGLRTHRWSACLEVPKDQGIAWLGVLPLALYLTFNVGTNQVNGIYTYWHGGIADCATSTANIERLDYGPIGQSIGGLYPYHYVSNRHGLTVTEANNVECNGTSVAAQDNGYGAMAWGLSGEVEMEYNLTTGVNYKIYAKAGYKGLFKSTDANNDAYSTGPGIPLTKNGAPFTVVWLSADGGTTTPTVLSNAYCGTTDTDCVAAGDCTVTPDDGHGHSVLTFQCGYGYDLIGLVFPVGSSVPLEIFTVNPNGQ